MWPLLLLAFSTGGLISSLLVVYLFYILAQLPPGCYAGEILPGITADCIKVLTSQYAYVGPLPLDALAAGWFMVNIMAVLLFYRAIERIAKFLFWWRLLGVGILPYLLYLEFIVLKAVCIYCTVMHIFIIADFVVISIFLRRLRSLQNLG